MRLVYLLLLIKDFSGKPTKGAISQYFVASYSSLSFFRAWESRIRNCFRNTRSKIRDVSSKESFYKTISTHLRFPNFVNSHFFLSFPHSHRYTNPQTTTRKGDFYFSAPVLHLQKGDQSSPLHDTRKEYCNVLLYTCQ
jgi:hypothetical protein